MAEIKSSLSEDVEELLAAPPKGNHQVCAVAYGISQFDRENQAKLNQVIDRPHADVEKIFQFFAKQGIDIPLLTIRRHRSRLKNNGSGCKCPVMP